MPSALIYFDKEEDDKIREFALKWRLTKHDVLKRIVREFEEKEIK